MCGIWALFGLTDEDLLRYGLADCLKIAHRGPDMTRIETVKDVPHSLLGFHRLEVNDSTNGMQPMRLRKQYPHIWLVFNGEIYNAFTLRDFYEFPFESQCDAEVIIHLYASFGAEKTAAMLDGVFAFAILDTKLGQLYLGRDVFGVRPLFTYISEGALGLCSEVKGLQYPATSMKAEIHPFPPGHVRTYELDSRGKCGLVSEKRAIAIGDTDPKQGMVLSSDVQANVRMLLKEAVRKRLIGGRRIGCLLSGGLDSSLVTALVVECIRESGSSSDPIQTFSIGMEGSPDVEHARLVASHLNTEHHEISFTAEEGFQALRDVIYSLESYDITTIRASVGMYLVSKYIRENTDTAIIFSGEGADELCQGYIHFHKAPTPQEADTESRRLLQDIYLYDNLRADRTTAAHGLELRVPFLDKSFTSYYLSLPAEDRQPRDGIEKYFLRQCFSDTGLIPDAVLWRPKEAFSDGVSSKKMSWFQHLQEKIDEKISDSMLLEASERFQGLTPISKEAYYYRLVFEELFPCHHHLTPYYWMPKWSDVADPSGRLLLKHYK
jgi:asparagine synthase (glutamine-hydrolysing)